MYFKQLLITVLILQVSISANAQEVDYSQKKYDLPTLDQAATIDGILDEPHWQEALEIQLTYERAPSENIPASQNTTAYIYENSESLFIAFRAEDTNISELRAYIRDRDDSFNDDFVGVQLDTFNDEQRAYEFFVNPYGSQMDLLFDETSRNGDPAWDGIWDSAATINEDSYIVEMQIPFSNLRFESGESIKTWGIEFLRRHPREFRRTFSSSPRNRNRNCRLCQFNKFSGFQNAQQGNQLEINPVLTIGKSETRNDAGELISNGTEYEPGLNIRWGITPEITLDATINPDFSQVESDAAQLSVNENFALFFDEKRPFFQEGANFFNSNTRAIYTRTVTDPDFGVKLTGRQDAHTLGVFAVQDAVTNIIIPGTFGSDLATINESSNVFAGRYRYDFNPDFNLGVISTYREAGDYRNILLSVDGYYRWQDKHTFRFQYIDTDTTNPVDIQDEFSVAAEQSGDALRLNYRYNTRDWFGFANYINRDEDFRADLGFITQVNNEEIFGGLGRNFYNEDSWWNRVRVLSIASIAHDQEGELLEESIQGRIEINALLQSEVVLGLTVRDRLFEDTLFPENIKRLDVEFSPFGALNTGIEINWGKRIDFSESLLADNIRINPFADYAINQNLSLEARHTYNKLESDAGRDLTANLTDARLKYQFDTRSFLRLTLQYENIESISRNSADFGSLSESEGLNAQLLYSYKVNPRTVFFLGYSDLADDDNDEQRLETQERGLFMKIGYVFDY